MNKCSTWFPPFHVQGVLQSPMEPPPVSYTHLESTGKYPSLEQAKKIRQHREEKTLTKEIVRLLVIGAVSYTHLDVYKRQTYDYAVALRAVKTIDFMTAESAEIPYAVLNKMSIRDRLKARVIDELRPTTRAPSEKLTGKPSKKVLAKRAQKKKDEKEKPRVKMCIRDSRRLPSARW